MPQKTQALKNQEIQSKKGIYYSALLNAWINSKNEKDKQIITLSSVGIGFTISIIAAIKDDISIWTLLVSAVIMGIFCYNILLGLRIFNNNSDYIKSILEQDKIKSKELDIKLKTEDKRFNNLFKMAMAMLCLLGIILGLTFFTGGKMTEKQKRENGSQVNSKIKIEESFHGLVELSPENLNSLKAVPEKPNIVPQPTNQDSTNNKSNQNNLNVNMEEK